MMQVALNVLQSVKTDRVVFHCRYLTSDSAPGPDVVWKTPTTVTATVLLMAGLLFAVFWSIVHCRPDQCQTYFQKEQLPHSLVSPTASFYTLDVVFVFLVMICEFK